MLIEHTENGSPQVSASSIRQADGKWRSFTIRRLESATTVSQDLRDNLTLPLLPYMKSACTIFSMKNFWNELNKPIFILAPMEDVTDTVLRQVIARCGKPAVFFTEFTNVEGMFSKESGLLPNGFDIRRQNVLSSPKYGELVLKIFSKRRKN